MATRIKQAKNDLYERDFYVWIERQAVLLRDRRFWDLDLDNLIEEMEALGGADRSKVPNNARVIIEHLQHSPATSPHNARRATVREHRRRLENDLTPRLQQVIADDLGRQFAKAREDAAASLRDHGEQAGAAATLETCPYTLDQVTGDWLS